MKYIRKCYIVVDGTFNEGYDIIKIFDSFTKAEKHIIDGDVVYMGNYKRKNKNRWVNGCDFIEILECEIE